MKKIIVLIGIIILFSCKKNEDTFITNNFTDYRDNQTYTFKQYGTQTWSTENLNYKSENSRYYNNDSLNKKYGRLYSFEDAQNVCPEGWKIPSYEDWITLANYINSDSLGNDLKSDSLWDTQYYKSSNKLGFNGLPAGVGQSSGDIELNRQTYWWTSTEENENSAYSPALLYFSYTLNLRATDKTYYYSVRCIKQ
jgi:uncharacterized protein (TIGR02145 family)